MKDKIFHIQKVGDLLKNSCLNKEKNFPLIFKIQNDNSLEITFIILLLISCIFIVSSSIFFF